MNPRISILPLPGEIGFLKGRYGLEQCLARGIIRIHTYSFTLIKSLKLELNGSITCHIWDSLDSRLFSMKRKKVLFQEFAVLLEDFECTDLDLKWFDIPFELCFPSHDEITFGFGPCAQLLPCSMKCSGKGGWKDDYEAKIEYYLNAVLSLPSSIPYFGAQIVEKVAIVPFLIWDPRLMTLIMHTEERKWKSHVGAKPIEYEIEIGSMVFGPGDVLNFSYRILVNSQFARCGVRIRRIQFILKEYHWIGEDRCCIKDDQHDWGHGTPFRVRSQRELCKWVQVEYPPPQTNFHVDSSLSYPAIGEGKYDGLAILNRKFPGNDGIYVERRGELRIPSLESVNPSTARPVPNPNDNICNYHRPRKAFIAIRHTITCMIEMKGADTISIESGCYLAGVGSQDCSKLLDTDPLIVPTLDYQKASGISELDHWVPSYDIVEDSTLDQENSLHADISLSKNDCHSLLDPDAIEIIPPIMPLRKTAACAENSSGNKPGLDVHFTKKKESVAKSIPITTESLRTAKSGADGVGRSHFALDGSVHDFSNNFSDLPPDYEQIEVHLAEPCLRLPSCGPLSSDEILDLNPKSNESNPKTCTNSNYLHLEERMAEAMNTTFFEL